VLQVAFLRPGETLLVHSGSSGIGTMAIQLGKAVGARVAVTVGGGADVILDVIGATYLDRDLDALAVNGCLVAIGMQCGSKNDRVRQGSDQYGGAGPRRHEVADGADPLGLVVHCDQAQTSGIGAAPGPEAPLRCRSCRPVRRAPVLPSATWGTGARLGRVHEVKKYPCRSTVSWAGVEESL